MSRKVRASKVTVESAPGTVKETQYRPAREAVDALSPVGEHHASTASITLRAWGFLILPEAGEEFAESLFS